MQEGTCQLLKELSRHGQTLLETNGSLDIGKVPPGVITILDIKCPGSGYAAKNEWRNLAGLGQQAEVKFIICDRRDYEWAKDIITEHQLAKRCNAINLSPAAGFMSAPTLARWIMKDRLPVRFNLQLHKTIWPKAARGK